LHFYPNLNSRDKSLVGHFDGNISNLHSSESNPITLTTPKLNNFNDNVLDCNASKLVDLWKLQDIC
jgi:hypothetical protein